VPELPEVETVRRGLEQRTSGLLVKRVEVLRERAIAAPADHQAFAKGLEGSQIQEWRRRGKYLLASLRRGKDSGGYWGVHLRMTGQFLWLPEPLPPCSHTRVRIWNPEGQELRFIDMRSFAQMWWVPPGDTPEMQISGLGRLGPEPFDPSFNAAYLHRKLRTSKRPIKTALLDQSLVAGVGNIYADESLFGAGISPHCTANSLDLGRLEALHTSLVSVLRASIGAGGTTFSDFRDLTGTNGNYGGEARVYRRSGKPCHTCGSLILRDRLAGRSSHWCPQCQH
jgi:formamidopyrimidine-DNA glycosylase